MALTLKPLHPFAAEASGIDLSKPIDAATAAEIEAAMDRHAVLVWRDQPLEEEEQLAFTKWFGPFDKGLNTALRRINRFRNEDLIDISNVAPDGSIRAREDQRMLSQLANQLWHSDSSFKSPPAKYSLLAARVVPPDGGETEYADERMAYDALPESTKKFIDGLVAEHFALYSRKMLSDLDFTPEELKALPPVRWPLVRTHAGSGRRHLYIGIHITQIVGMSVAEGRLLAQELLEHATQREFVYRHRWRVNDLVMWDNRCVLHRGKRYDLSQRRELRRSTTEDVASVALSSAAE
jgi:alpha-ketoglutarate-dependent 2,4-dichlorophenoxyacetate dioxygenase